MESPGIEMRNLILSRRSSCNASEASISRLSTNQLQRSPSGGQYAPLHPRDPQTPLKTSGTFDGACQTRRLLFKRTLRWIGTVIFAALIIVTLKIYEGKGNFSSNQKTVFNTTTVALILGLGLNVFVSRTPANSERTTTCDRPRTVAYISQEAFKESARVLRWRILADETHTERETDLILGIENLLNVCALARESVTKLRMLVPCILWLLINLLAQVSVALVSLTYTVDDGRTYHDTYFTNGIVNAPNLTSYFANFRPLAPELNQAVAHSYGETLQSAGGCGRYEDIAQVYNSTDNPPYFCRRTRGKQEFAYRFKEDNKEDSGRSYPSLTNRVVTASSGVCFNYTELNHTLGRDLYNNMAAWNYTFSNSTYNSTISIPISSEGWAATTYIYRGTALPHLDAVNSCGTRCMWIWAHRASIPGNDTSTFYQCPITISEVSNTTTNLQGIPDSVARVAAASIALQGRWSGPKNKKIWTQYQFYPFNTRWETHGLPDEKAGANMAEFALRSLATMAEQNPSIQFPSRVPHLGSRLTIYSGWRYVGALLACIVGVDFALLITIVWMTKSVVVTDDSNVVIARLLNGVTKDFEEKATLLRGKTLCEAITEQRRRRRDGKAGRDEEGETAHPSDDGIVYGPFRNEEGNYVLAMGESIRSRKQWEGERHPDGNYL